MKRKIIFLILLFVPSVAFSDDDIFMSYNVLCNVCNRNPDFFESWDNRKNHVFNVISQESPDILGVQEIYDSMQQDFFNEYGETHEVYSGTLSDDTLSSVPGGLMNLILYRKSKYQFLDGGSFRLSKQPDNSIPVWQDAYKRICTWSLLETKTEELLKIKALSCHLPAGNSTQTKIAVEELAEWLWTNQDSNLPHFIMGDFNSSTSSASMTYLTSEVGSESSYIYPDGFRKLTDDLDEGKIDFVLRTSSGFNFSDIYKTGVEQYLGNFRPSDHPAIVLKGNLIKRSSVISVNTIVNYLIILDE